MDVKKELIQGLKAILTKWEGQEPVVEVKMETLDDGTKIRIDGEVLEVDKSVFVITDAGEVPIPDGTYVVESGDSFTTVEGIVTEVMKKEDAPAAPTDMQENVELSAIKEEFQSLKSEVNSLKILLDKSKESEKTVLSVAKKLTEVLESLSAAPSSEPTETKHSATIQKEEKLSSLVKTIKSLKK